eukprot:TRINITY_DN3328_c0_g2_i1.p2 TRINITY_DN3328_c0_g2~~TRINITY_DN3328_c0_g2_i1.p2  ORF type:complete len:106 (-),score=15.09 TRINITY_DN3328_c0_g2_i1:1207-1524(-)
MVVSRRVAKMATAKATEPLGRASPAGAGAGLAGAGSAFCVVLWTLQQHYCRGRMEGRKSILDVTHSDSEMYWEDQSCLVQSEGAILFLASMRKRERRPETFRCCC